VRIHPPPSSTADYAAFEKNFGTFYGAFSFLSFKFVSDRIGVGRA
jgi:hypothetical protein